MTTINLILLPYVKRAQNYSIFISKEHQPCNEGNFLDFIYDTGIGAFTFYRPTGEIIVTVFLRRKFKSMPDI